MEEGRGGNRRLGIERGGLSVLCFLYVLTHLSLWCHYNLHLMPHFGAPTYKIVDLK